MIISDRTIDVLLWKQWTTFCRKEDAQYHFTILSVDEKNNLPPLQNNSVSPAAPSCRVKGAVFWSGYSHAACSEKRFLTRRPDLEELSTFHTVSTTWWGRYLAQFKAIRQRCGICVCVRWAVVCEFLCAKWATGGVRAKSQGMLLFYCFLRKLVFGQGCSSAALWIFWSSVTRNHLQPHTLKETESRLTVF